MKVEIEKVKKGTILFNQNGYIEIIHISKSSYPTQYIYSDLEINTKTGELKKPAIMHQTGGTLINADLSKFEVVSY